MTIDLSIEFLRFKMQFQLRCFINQYYFNWYVWSNRKVFLLITRRL